MNMTSSHRKYKLISIASVPPPISGMHPYRMWLIFRWSTNLLRGPLNAQVGFQDAFLTGRHPVRILMRASRCAKAAYGSYNGARKALFGLYALFIYHFYTFFTPFLYHFSSSHKIPVSA